MMLRFPEFSRDLRRGEEGAVDALLRAAHGDASAARAVTALRAAGDIAGEVVLPCQGDIVGYYALAQMRAPKGWLVLAALAVAPDWQGQGHGRRLMGVLSEWARLSGRCVIAPGPLRFFERAGFRAGPGGIPAAGLTGGEADLPPLHYPAAMMPRA